MLEEANTRLVNTPRVRSRAEAWQAWEAAMKAKYSKIRKKIEKTKDKDLNEFNEEVQGDYYKLWMYVHNTRPRRKDLYLENLDGTMEWVSLKDARGKWPLTNWKIHPDFEFYRKRQEYAIELREIREVDLSNFVFREGFHDHELTPEELEKRREEEEQAWYEEQTRIAVRQEQYRREDEERKSRQLAEHRLIQEQLVSRIVSNWNFLERPVTREDVAQGGALFRVLYLIESYDKIDQLVLDIMVNTLRAIDRNLSEEFAILLVVRILGYANLDEVKDAIESGIIPNLNKRIKQ